MSDNNQALKEPHTPNPVEQICRLIWQHLTSGEHTQADDDNAQAPEVDAEVIAMDVVFRDRRRSCRSRHTG